MKWLKIALLLICCVPTGCAAVADHYRMKAYSETMDSYETAMRISDFNVICNYVDPEVMGRQECVDSYDNLKIASYDVRAFNVSPDNLYVEMTVEISYFFLDRYVLRKTQFEQTWHYVEDKERWLLKSKPPIFK